MTHPETASRFPAACEGCGKSYRVPSADRAYKCSACGGRVSASAIPAGRAAPATTPRPRPAQREPARRGAPDPGPTCANCSAVNLAGARFCAECGEALGRQGAARERSADRRMATAELQRIARSVKVLRWVYGTFAVIVSVVALFLLKATAALSQLGLDSEGRTALILFTAIMVVQALLLITGTVQVARHPFVWGILMAAFQTLTAVMGLLAGKYPIVPIVLAALLWVMVVPTARLRRILREHPDLHAARRFTGERGPHHTGAAGSRPMLVVGIVVGVLALGGVLFRFLTRPQRIEPVAERFASSWNALGPAAVVDFFPSALRLDVRENLARLPGDYGWDERLPRITGDPQVKPPDASGRVECFFELGDDEIHTVWQYLGREWRLIGFAPPLGDLPDRFRAAWNRSDVPAIASFAKEPARMERNMRDIAVKHGWLDGFPKLGEPTFDSRSSDSILAVYPSDEGPLALRWGLEDGRWTPVINLRSMR